MSSNQTTGFLEIQNTEENLWYKQEKKCIFAADGDEIVVQIK